MHCGIPITSKRETHMRYTGPIATLIAHPSERKQVAAFYAKPDAKPARPQLVAPKSFLRRILGA